MKVLVGCEESQAVTIRLRALGIEAFSCDVQPCSGGFSEWHLQCSIFDIINDNWTCLICFPPCTHLAVSGAAHFEKKRADGRQQEAIDFFMALANADIKHIAIENPVGIMSSVWRKPDQKIQPYYFGDEAQKTTCLWLKNLPPLYHNDRPNLFTDEVTHVGKGDFFEWTDKKTGRVKKQPQWYADVFLKHGIDADLRQRIRSKTFDGIADAMANNWGNYLLEKYKL